jgi:hypothetical protein
VLPWRPRGLAASQPAPQTGGGESIRDRVHLPKLPHLSNPFDGAKPLSIQEQSKLRPILRDALKEACKYADEGMSLTNRARAECTVWSGENGLDDEELDALADIMIARGSINAAVAQTVRGMVSVYQEAQVLIIMGPRVLASYRFYKGNGGFTLPL